MSEIKATRSPSEKLQKVLADAGLGSRRQLEGWIEAGRIKVNGQVATLGDRVGEHDEVLVDDRPLRRKEKQRLPRVLIYNKPEGEICTRKDTEGRPTVFHALPKLKGERWVAVGRLDVNTSGLLLFTNSGELANALMHPSRQVEREYAARVLGEVDDGMLQRLQEGVLLEDGIGRFNAIKHGGGEGANQWYHVTISEGRNREVRRLWDSQGVKVSRLKRVRYGIIVLPARVRRGHWEELSESDTEALMQLAGLYVAPKPRTMPGRNGKPKPAPTRRNEPAQRKRPPEDEYGHGARPREESTPRTSRGGKPAGAGGARQNPGLASKGRKSPAPSPAAQAGRQSLGKRSKKSR